MNIKIITPDRRYLECDATSIDVQGISGELGILPGHAPMVTELGVGALKIKESNGSSAFFVNGGYLNVVDDKVTVLADIVETKDVIDQSRVQEALNRATTLLKKQDEKVDISRALAALKRAEARKNYLEMQK